MQFEPGQDFFLRNTTASDRAACGEMLAQYVDEGRANRFMTEFPNLLLQKDSLFKVALNSNGVIIAMIYCLGQDWQELAANPNFLKKELKTALVNEVKNWALAHSFTWINIKPKLIVGDWKTWVKRMGLKMEKLPNGEERISFVITNSELG